MEDSPSCASRPAYIGLLPGYALWYHRKQVFNVCPYVEWNWRKLHAGPKKLSSFIEALPRDEFFYLESIRWPSILRRAGLYDVNMYFERIYKFLLILCKHLSCALTCWDLVDSFSWNCGGVFDEYSVRYSTDCHEQLSVLHLDQDWFSINDNN